MAAEGARPTPPAAEPAAAPPPAADGKHGGPQPTQTVAVGPAAAPREPSLRAQMVGLFEHGKLLPVLNLLTSGLRAGGQQAANVLNAFREARLEIKSRPQAADAALAHRTPKGTSQSGSRGGPNSIYQGVAKVLKILTDPTSRITESFESPWSTSSSSSSSSTKTGASSSTAMALPKDTTPALQQRQILDARDAWQSEVLFSRDPEVLAALYRIIGDIESEVPHRTDADGMPLLQPIKPATKAALRAAIRGAESLYGHTLAWNRPHQQPNLSHRLWTALLLFGNVPVGQLLQRHLLDDTGPERDRFITLALARQLLGVVSQMTPTHKNLLLSKDRPSEWVTALLHAFRTESPNFWHLAVNSPDVGRTLYHWTRLMGRHQAGQALPHIIPQLAQQTPRMVEACLDGLVDAGLEPTELIPPLLGVAERLRFGQLRRALDTLLRPPLSARSADGEDTFLRSTGAPYVAPPQAGTLAGDAMLQDILSAAQKAVDRCQDSAHVSTLLPDVFQAVCVHLAHLDASMGPQEAEGGRWLPDWPRINSLLSQSSPALDAPGLESLQAMHEAISRGARPPQPIYPAPHGPDYFPDEFNWQVWSVGIDDRPVVKRNAPSLKQCIQTYLDRAFPLNLGKPPSAQEVAAEAEAFTALRYLYPTAMRLAERWRQAPGVAPIAVGMADVVRHDLESHLRRFFSAPESPPQDAARLALMKKRREVLEKAVAPRPLGPSD